MLNPTFQMRAPSMRRIAMASILMISLAALLWSFNRLLPRVRGLEGAPASEKQEAGGREQGAESGNAAILRPSSEAKLIDSDKDGIPDVVELRTFQDRDSFRRWFTAIAEMQFYRLS